jgi:dipeptidase E
MTVSIFVLILTVVLCSGVCDGTKVVRNILNSEEIINCSLINSTSRSQPRKIYAAGSGLDMLSQPDTISEIIALSGKEKPNVLYIGTATYDAEAEMNIQTKEFAARGCEINALKITHGDPGINAMCQLVEHADILLVSGGNTLFAVDRMKTVGLDQIIKGADKAGKVLCGGSAGGIVWFQNGHSDSGDPASFLTPNGPLFKDNLTKAQLGSAWNYVKVPGLNILPGLFVPHFDKIESNGQRRNISAKKLLRHNAGETMTAIDNWSALRIEGDTYTFIAREGKSGSCNVPCGFVLKVNPITGEVEQTQIPKSGMVSDIIMEARYTTESLMLPVLRAMNPDPNL